MSTMSMSHSAAKKNFQSPSFPLPSEIAPKSLTDMLIEISAVQPGDHVTVVGGTLSDHLVGLARWGCVSAIGIQPGSRLSPFEPADVVWFSEIDATALSRATLSLDIGNPRAVVLVTRAVDDLGWVQDDLRRLASKGLVQCAYHQFDDRLLVVASRPKWLRQVV
ncbi:hypothetical protein [Telmatospirillum sp.]|uniref:hypothetical protein n=1 Tax=Telmatospirillum sp. TaxID=2079197 RepID=UPI002842A104|nr:hypothetical protein [Telmatospirillum sp.]MDR3438494.1 hypothetical protein [Telmatospirillum sp.]